MHGGACTGPPVVHSNRDWHTPAAFLVKLHKTQNSPSRSAPLPSMPQMMAYAGAARRACPILCVRPRLSPPPTATRLATKKNTLHKTLIPAADRQLRRITRQVQGHISCGRRGHASASPNLAAASANALTFCRPTNGFFGKNYGPGDARLAFSATPPVFRRAPAYRREKEKLFQSPFRGHSARGCLHIGLEKGVMGGS